MIALLSVITLFACEGNYKNIQQLSIKDNAPVGDGEGIRTVYTDSGRVVSTMITEKVLNFENLNFGYQEFPQGIEVHFWDEEDRETVVTSSYAIQFSGTEIVDLREDVVVTTHDSTVVNAKQLYWDQKNRWVFTDEPYKITLPDGSFNNGAGFDSNEDFTQFLSRKNDGIQLIEKKETNTETDDQ